MERPPLDHQEAYTPEEDDPDYRFSEAHGYAEWEAPRRSWLKVVTIAISVLVILSMALPMLMVLAGGR